MSTNAQHSFKQYKYAPPPKRIIMSVEGLEREGKTHLALTAPGPLGYMQMDPGGDAVVPKIKQLFPHKVLHLAQYTVQITGQMSDVQKADAAKKVWLQTVNDYEYALRTLTSLVIDTNSEWFTCLKIAAFGRLTQVMPEQYAPVYAEYRRLLRMAYSHNCNLILLHKLKEEYEDGGKNEKTGKRNAGRKTGNLVREGFKGIAYEVDMVVRAFRDPDDRSFQFEVKNCRQNPDADGIIMPADPETGFADLAQLAFPETTAKDWGGK